MDVRFHTKYLYSTMKPLRFFPGLLFFFLSCSSPDDQTSKKLQAEIDSLRQQLDSTYKPGFGEFMSGIQVHHEKLWFAGLNSNWKLADFEINEMKEALQDLQTYCKDRPERQSLTMIMGPLESVNKAVQTKDLPSFKSAFITLTNTCNTCHQATNHAFNVIRLPETPPFSNQVFKPDEHK
jgi:hypothetical protein